MNLYKIYKYNKKIRSINRKMVECMVYRKNMKF